MFSHILCRALCVNNPCPFDVYFITGKHEKCTMIPKVSTNSKPAYIIYPFGLEIDTDFKGHLSTMGITRMPRYMLN